MNRAQKGARFERKVIHELVENGWSCIRGAASKSYGQAKIDIIAIKDGHIRIIQCKNFKLSTKAKLKLWEGMRKEIREGYYYVELHIISKEDKQ